ncbi:MAG: hypothetical protein R6U36_03560 [Candidatus Fermentibacteraceae bacterium]
MRIDKADREIRNPAARFLIGLVCLLASGPAASFRALSRGRDGEGDSRSG